MRNLYYTLIILGIVLIFAASKINTVNDSKLLNSRRELTMAAYKKGWYDGANRATESSNKGRLILTDENAIIKAFEADSLEVYKLLYSD